MFSIYKVLYDEYKNEEKAKKEVYKIASQSLKKFGAVSDIYEATELLLAQYKTSSDEKLKYDTYNKIKVLNEALELIDSVLNNGG